MVGEFTTQLRVGQFDLQFTFGKVDFAITGPITLIRLGEAIGKWVEGRWPDPQFFEVMNSAVRSVEVRGDRLIVLHLENDIEIHLEDDSDEYECMVITIEGSGSWII
ncbi:MAG TPA: hypothetical protein VGS57_09170 [Thermoanaerobaculia bacterium]|nr:hypothetical protein [Thermoanaerobaculia bacterium]